LLLGLILYYLLINLPIIGFLFAALTTLIAVGAFMSSRKDMYKKGLEAGVF